MKILVLANENQAYELHQKFGDEHHYVIINSTSEEVDTSNFDVVFDFLIDEFPDTVEFYQHNKNLPVFISSAKTSLREQRFVHGDFSCALFGFNGIPTFVNRELFEVSILDSNQHATLAAVCGSLHTDYIVVDDRVGLVTPRVVCMIINEAFYTVQEGTATKEDIDKGMKLGTNYPHGPFEWCEKIGVTNVYEVLEAIYEDTKDERYKICPLLKKEYLSLV